MTLEYTETVFQHKSDYTVLDIPCARILGENARMEFRANLKRYRKAKQWTQGVLAEKIGVAQPTYQRWEAGEREPSHADLVALAKALEVPVADLFREEDSEPVPNADELTQMIERAMRELPIGVTFEDYPSAVASSLHDQLRQYQAVGGFRRNEDEGNAPGKGAPPRAPTRQSGRAGSRTQ